MSKIELYQNENGQTIVDVTFDKETIWLNQSQIATLFNKERTVISKHLKTIFSEGELDKISNVQKMHITDFKPTTFYNLDVIISVGYRVKSLEGTKFRQWATQRLRDYLVEGCAIN